MAEELGYAHRRDEVYIKTHTLKKGPQKGHHVPQAATIINELLEAAEKHPDWKEKSIKEGDLFARVCGMKEPRGRVRVLGLGPTPQDVGTPGTRGKTNTRALVEIVARRESEQRMKTMEEQMQQMQEQINKMKEMMSAAQGGHTLEAPSSQHGSNSRQNLQVELEEDNDGDEDDEEIDIWRRVVPNPFPKISSTHQDEAFLGWMFFCMLGLVRNLLLLRQQLSRSTQILLWEGSPLGQKLMRLLRMFRLEGMLRCHINMMIYDTSAMLSEGLLHGQLAR